MAKPHPRSSRLNQLDALFGVLSDAHTRTMELRKEVDRLEAIAAAGDLPDAWHHGDWNDLTGIPEEDAENERKLRELASTYWGGIVADVVREVRRFRSTVDAALVVLAVSGGAIDGKEVLPDSWSVLVEGELRKLRGCILNGQGRTAFPSALPWVGQGVDRDLSKHQVIIYDRMQEVNSMRNVLRKRAAAEPPKPARAPKPKPRKPASPAVSDVVREAEAQHEAKLREDEQKLLADPSFMAAVKQGEHWEKARAAVAKAQAPLQAELDALIAKHPVNQPDSKIGKRIEALMWALQDTQIRVLAEHGFIERKPFTMPMQMLEALRKFKWSGWTTIQEITDRPRLTDTWWSDAETMRKLNPSLPPLPEKPEDGRTRLFLLYRWCERCLNLPEEEIAAFIHEPAPTVPEIEACPPRAECTLTQAVEWFFEPVTDAISKLATGPKTDTSFGWRMPRGWQDAIRARYLGFVSWCQQQNWFLDDNARPRLATAGKPHFAELDTHRLISQYRTRLEIVRPCKPPLPGEWVDQERFEAMKVWVQEIRTRISLVEPARAGPIVESKPTLILRDPSQGPLVCGVEKPVLSAEQYDVVFRLIQVGPKGEVGSALVKSSRHGDAVNILKRLSRDPEWARVLLLPGLKGRGYRVLSGSLDLSADNPTPKVP